MRRDPRLTEEQDAMRLGGLRILARMIVRAHLASLADEEEVGGTNDASCRDGLGRPMAVDEGLPWKEGGHGR